MQVERLHQEMFTLDNPIGLNKNCEIPANPLNTPRPNPIAKKMNMKSLFFISNLTACMMSSLSVSAVKLGGISGLFFQNRMFKAAAPAWKNYLLLINLNKINIKITKNRRYT